jgi:hypothetical protein
MCKSLPVCLSVHHWQGKFVDNNNSNNKKKNLKTQFTA